ncbi:putative ankyrin repeat protein RF_0381 isoform X2 [Halyomorpha halys]|uniref:putative ankyrin repeat protein RF_0381 isoform X2 n=1 Tax=Halyomorpha halys TaxID=286706 RepID=UPI0006D4DACF|nr:uncharacterized protein LOC106687460 isoform X2 [Halyomorpha halys]
MASINNREQTLEGIVSFCCSITFKKLWSGASYGAAASIYKPINIASMELSSPQCLLLALLNSLVTGDVMYCILLASFCQRVQQLRSKYLKVWLTEDFVFPRQDLVKAMVLLDELVVTGLIKLPPHVMGIMSTLAAKYKINGVQVTSPSEEYCAVLAVQLENAVANNSPSDIIALATEGGDINGLTESGDSLLHLAARAGNCASIAALGFLKANLEVVSSTNVTPLEEAISANNASSVKTLLLAGATLVKRLVRGDTYLHLAATKFWNETLKALLDGGLEINETNYLGETALFQAVKVGNVQGVEILLEQGADINIAPEGKNYLFMTALESQNLDMVKTFLKGRTVPKFHSENGDTILHFLAQSGNAELLKAIRDKNLSTNIKNYDGLAPIHLTSESSIIKILFEMGADINIKTEEGETALYCASARGALELVRALVQQGAAIDRQTYEGKTALMIASRNSNPRVVRFLLDNGAIPMIKDEDGWTSLHYAAQAGCMDSVIALLEAGASINVKDNEGNTPVFIAATSCNLAVLQQLVDRGADLTLRDNSGQGLLHHVARSGRARIVSMLLNSGVAVDMKGPSDWTALHIAADGGHARVVSVLLDRGADPRAKAAGWTPLMSATVNGFLDVVKLLCDRGAAPNDRSNLGRTALYYARTEGHRAIASYLISKGGIE